MKNLISGRIKFRKNNCQVETGTVILQSSGLHLECLALPPSLSICYSILLKRTCLISKENIQYKGGYKTQNCSICSDTEIPCEKVLNQGHSKFILLPPKIFPFFFPSLQLSMTIFGNMLTQFIHCLAGLDIILKNILCIQEVVFC